MFYRAFRLFYLVVYLPPILYGVIFSDIFFAEFYGEKVNILAVFSVGLWFIVFSLFFLWAKGFTIRRRISVSLSRFFIWVFLLIFLIVSIRFAIDYWGTSFRHSKRFSEEGSLSMLVFLFRNCAGLLCIPFVMSGGKFIRTEGRLMLFVLFIGLTITLNGSLQVILSFLLLMLLINPRFFRKKLSFGKILLFIPIAILVLVVGIGGKIGYDVLFTLSLKESFHPWFGIVLTRVSTSFMSVNTFFETLPLDYTVDGWKANIETGLNRLNYFFGQYDKSRLDTVDRRNYLMLFRQFNVRAGATPFLVGSCFYINPLVGLIFTSTFSAFLLRWCEVFAVGKITLTQGIAVVFLLLSFFEAPLNLLLLVDILPFSLLFLLLLSVINFDFLYE